MILNLFNKQASDKVLQKEAGYFLPVDKNKHDKPSGMFSCGNCKNFEPPHGCKGVEGYIVQGGCCNYYSNPELAEPV